VRFGGNGDFILFDFELLNFDTGGAALSFAELGGEGLFGGRGGGEAAMLRLDDPVEDLGGSRF